jgi:hypothetical protein
MAEERASPENKDVPMLKLATHVRPKYDAWKEKNGLSQGAEVEKPYKKGRTRKGKSRGRTRGKVNRKGKTRKR